MVGGDVAPRPRPPPPPPRRKKAFRTLSPLNPPSKCTPGQRPLFGTFLPSPIRNARFFLAQRMRLLRKQGGIRSSIRRYLVNLLFIPVSKATDVSPESPCLEPVHRYQHLVGNANQSKTGRGQQGVSRGGGGLWTERETQNLQRRCLSWSLLISSSQSCLLPPGANEAEGIG